MRASSPPDFAAPREVSHWFALPAALGLFAVFAMAFSSAVRPHSADLLTLFTLGIVALSVYVPRLRVLSAHRDAACFFLTVCAFIVYGLARGAGPAGGWTLRFPLLEDGFVVPYAARAAMLGALFSLPLWGKHRGGWTNALLAALLFIALFAAGSFWFLGRFLTVGETEELDPRPMLVTLLQVVEYASLALCCAAICAHQKLRVLTMRILPFALLTLWARHAFFAAPPVEEIEE